MSLATEAREHIHHQGVKVAAVLNTIVDRRRQGAGIVSLTLAVLAVRKAVPACDLSDRELADMVAIRAVERGCNIAFDADLLGIHKPA